MIKLMEIKKNDNAVTCNAFIEDCNVAIPIVYDLNSRELSHGDIPEGYTWCSNHMKHARVRLEAMIREKTFPETVTVMWY